METTRKLMLRKIVLVGDALVIVVSMLAAYALHTLARRYLPILKEPPQFRQYAVLAYLALPLWLSLVATLRLHRCFERAWTAWRLLVDLVKLHVVGLVALSLLLFLTQAVVNRTLVGLYLLSTLTGMWLARIAAGRWLRREGGSGFGRPRALLVGGSAADLVEFVTQARADPLPPELVGYLSDPEEDATAEVELPDGFPPPLGGLDELPAVLHHEGVDQVLFFPPFDRPERVPEALETLRQLGVPASFAIQRVVPFAAQPRVHSFYGEAFVSFEVAPKTPEALAIKHAVDVLLAGLAVVVLSPLLVLTALAVLATMGRPVLFVQERAGLYGRRFRMLKFRTMVKGAEGRRDELLDRNEMSGPVFKVTDDPRVTPLGRLLRRTSIDELPQLFNVLTGAMSLVGPRPLPYGEQQEVRGWHRRRLSMKPGITGLWQVSGRNEVDFEEWIQLDLRYIDEWSLRLDLRILARTVPAVLLRRGAR